MTKLKKKEIKDSLKEVDIDRLNIYLKSIKIIEICEGRCIGLHCSNCPMWIFREIYDSDCYEFLVEEEERKIYTDEEIQTSKHNIKLIKKIIKKTIDLKTEC